VAVFALSSFFSGNLNASKSKSTNGCIPREFNGVYTYKVVVYLYAEMIHQEYDEVIVLECKQAFKGTTDANCNTTITPTGAPDCIEIK
jgi:hypothetical protein